jgi:enoyl-CoA hydratase
MAYTTLLFDLADGIATITVNRPDKLNALNATVIAELDDAAGRIERERDIRGVLLTGAGAKAFVAGADISEIGSQGVTEGQARARAGQRMMRRLEQCGKPVVAAVNGFALGGGCELALACDIRIAAENALFGFPEVTLGILPGLGGTQRLPRLVGPGVAKEMIFSGRRIKAEEARMINLVNRVVPEGEALNAARELAGEIAANGPIAVQHAKAAANKAQDLDLVSGLEYEADQFALLFATEDAREGMGAFVEKRQAEFKGR